MLLSLVRCVCVGGVGVVLFPPRSLAAEKVRLRAVHVVGLFGRTCVAAVHRHLALLLPSDPRQVS